MANNYDVELPCEIVASTTQETEWYLSCIRNVLCAIVSTLELNENDIIIKGAVFENDMLH